MEKMQKIERLLYVATGMLVISILLMLIVIPGVFTKTLPAQNNTGAVIGILLAIIFRLLIFNALISLIKKSQTQ